MSRRGNRFGRNFVIKSKRKQAVWLLSDRWLRSNEKPVKCRIQIEMVSRKKANNFHWKRLLSHQNTWANVFWPKNTNQNQRATVKDCKATKPNNFAAWKKQLLKLVGATFKIVLRPELPNIVTCSANRIRQPTDQQSRASWTKWQSDHVRSKWFEQHQERFAQSRTHLLDVPYTRAGWLFLWLVVSTTSWSFKVGYTLVEGVRNEKVKAKVIVIKSSVGRAIWQWNWRSALPANAIESDQKVGGMKLAKCLRNLDKQKVKLERLERRDEKRRAKEKDKKKRRKERKREQKALRFVLIMTRKQNEN